MKKVKTIFLILVFVGPIFGFSQSNRIIALVNQEVITATDFNRYYQAISASEAAFFLFDQEKSLKANILERLIDDRLILQKAKREGIEAPESWIRQRIEQIASTYPDEASFVNSLEGQGIDLDYLRRRFEEQYLIRTMIDIYVKAQIAILPGQIRQHYKENKESLKSINKAYFLMARHSDKKALREIADFIDLNGIGKTLAEYRETLLSYELYLDQVHEVIESELRNLSDGSYVIKDIQGSYHLIYRRKLGPPRSISLDQIQEQIHSELWQSEFDQRFDKWTQSLRDEAVIITYF